MADSSAVRVKGLADLRKAVKAVDAAGLIAIRMVLKDAATLIATEAGRNAPRGTEPIYPSRKFKTRLADSYVGTTSGNRAVVRSRHPAALIKEYRKSGTEAEMRLVRPTARAIDAKEDVVAGTLAAAFDALIRGSGWN